MSRTALRVHLVSLPWLVLAATDPSAGDVLITEFLAAGDGGISVDEDGEGSDWLELHNDGAGEVDLDGWYLTDDRRDLTRWRIPAVRLAPGGYLLVFASGKERSRPGSELHTNFRLAREGEYLALVEPDGSTVAHEFFPAYPPQMEGLSYGIRAEVRTPVRRGAPVEVLVPGDAGDGAGWASPEFQPGPRWIRGASGVGYSSATGEAPAGLVSYWPFDGNLRDAVASNHGVFLGGPVRYAEAPTGVPRAVRFDGADDYVSVSQRSVLPIYNRPAFSVALWVKGLPQTDKRVFSEGSSTDNSPVFNIGTDVSGNSGRVDIFIRTASGSRLLGHTLSRGVAFDGAWRHLAWVDDGGRATLYIDGSPDATDFTYRKEPLPLDRTSIGAILRAGPSFHFDGDLAGVSLWDRLLTADEVALLAGRASPLGIGESRFDLVTGTDLLEAMRGVSASAYIRVPFLLEEPVVAASLLLRMMYDDGFVAYLNGVEVARRNAPTAPPWDAAATAERPRERALEFEEINITPAAMALRPGSNVLAVHGLNVAPDDPDFLILPELVSSSSLRTEEVYFRQPTPASANRGGAVAFAAAPEFSQPRGFHTVPFQLEILSATEGANIRYTLDGSAPTAQNGLLYEGPLVVETTTVLRAAAFHPSREPSDVRTRTYIFPTDVLRQSAPPGYPGRWSGEPADYAMDPGIVDAPAFRDTIEAALRSLPSVSIVMEFDDLFGPGGIYQNPTQTGSASERPASVEFIYGDGREGIQVNCGARIMGNRSRNPSASPKHGIRLVFKGKYGPRKLRFPLFPASRVDRFDTLAIRPNAFDSWVSEDASQRRGATYLRDEWVRSAQRATGRLTPNSLFVHLYLNGLYWGLYNLAERPDASFAASHLGGDKENYDAIKTHEEVVDGSLQAYREMDALRAAGLGSGAAYDAFRQYLDVDNLADYMIVNMFAPATDWPGNYYMVRERRPGAGFRLISWDSEYAFLGGVTNNRTLPHRRDPDSPTKFYHALRANPEFRLLFADHVERHFSSGGILTPGAAADRWRARAGRIEAALACEAARWGDHRRDPPYRPDVEWRAENDALLGQYFPRRSAIVLDQFRAQGMVPSTAAPSLRPNGGLVPPGVELLVESRDGSAAYYTIDGEDPRLPGGSLSPSARLAGGPVRLEETTHVMARARSGAEWSALSEATFVVDRPSRLRITEIMYHPAAPRPESAFAADDFEFIEIQNTGERGTSLVGVRLTTGVRFDFSRSARRVLGPGEVTVIVRNLSAFAERYDTEGMSIAGEYDGRLDNRQEFLRLVDALGRNILEAWYQDFWYPETDGGGSSLVASDPGAPEALWRRPEGWRAGDRLHGTPGESDPPLRGGRQLPGDANQDGQLDISDAIGLLILLFQEADRPIPCDAGRPGEGGAVEVLDVNGDRGVDLSDAVHTLRFLFQGGPPPARGTHCVRIEACPDACRG